MDSSKSLDKFLDIADNILKNFNKDNTFLIKSDNKFNKKEFLNYLDTKFKKFNVDDKLKVVLTQQFMAMMSDKMDFKILNVTKKKYKDVLAEIDVFLENNKKKNPIKNFNFYIEGIFSIIVKFKFSNSEQQKISSYIFLQKLKINEVTLKKLIIKSTIKELKNLKNKFKQYMKK